MVFAGLDAHARPPEAMRLLMKRWQKATTDQVNSANDILDTDRGTALEMVRSVPISQEAVSKAVSEFAGPALSDTLLHSGFKPQCFEIKSLPGLFIYPSLFPQSVQLELLDKMLHRDLSNPKHKTNLNLHYKIPYLQCQEGEQGGMFSSSFFERNPEILLSPKDVTMHKALTVKQMMNRKLRWMTLGGQYDWTAKVYPSEEPPAFPSDIGKLLSDIWPDVDAQAAIVNFYTPGDTLSVHRDVSEECDRGLISISIGCDALFIVGDQDARHQVTIRLRSGDAVMMSGQSRFAWHAVPKILPNTCPLEIQDWPYHTRNKRCLNWEGWLKDKRINLNVRQMQTRP